MSTPNKNVPKQKKNKKGVFSKTGIRTLFIVLMLLIEIGGLVTIIILSNFYNVRWLNIIYVVAEVISIICAIPIINSRMDPSYKITWLAFMVINSVLGASFYLLFANKKFTKKEKRIIHTSRKYLLEALDAPEANGVTKKLTQEDGDIYNFANYIKNYSYTDTYVNTRTTYFAWGELAFPEMLKQLKRAKHYIFLEYFIIQPGKFWDPILEILIEKAKAGVDVRLLYDDLGCLTTLPDDYDVQLRNQGIKAYKYSPLKPFVDVRMNNRDHRKIMVIDGHTGFTGGINIADEYINEVVRFGKWKDNAIMLEGDGVFGLTDLFLSTWARIHNLTTQIDFKEYLPIRYAAEVPPIKPSKGYVAVYGSIPYTYETVGLNIYAMLCYRAKKSLDIATPYLILNKEMEEAICQAAKNGVRVRLLVPKNPDKKIVFELTRSFYRMLIRSGVEVYEYSPGFVHAKMFLVDGEMATVGTINLDYRSLFLHCENGCFLYKNECIKDIQDDFERTFMVSDLITREKYDETSTGLKILRMILRVFAPLM